MPGPQTRPDPMAVQMAQLLAGSDADELREIIRRWVAEAPAGGSYVIWKTADEWNLVYTENLKTIGDGRT